MQKVSKVIKFAINGVISSHRDTVLELLKHLICAPGHSYNTSPHHYENICAMLVNSLAWQEENEVFKQTKPFLSVTFDQSDWSIRRIRR